jgi:hypothetical protein
MNRKKTITAHCLVKNEERFVWYSVMSVYNHVDKILLWDTGSTDGTLEIIKELEKVDKDKKISFREYGGVTKETFAKVRQEMLDQTETDWFLMVDGDEIWWEDSIKKVIEAINTKGDQIESIVVPLYNLVGDIYHYQEKNAGRYTLAGRTGHLSLRAINRKIPGLSSLGDHGVWGWIDNNKKMIQDRDQKKILYIEAPYLHATFLQRAKTKEDEKNVPKRTKKLKYEFGISFPADFYYPEVLFKERPEIVPSVWNKVDMKYKLRAVFETPLRKIKRRLHTGKAGY